MFDHQKTAQKAAEKHARLEKLKKIYRKALSSSLKLTIIEEVGDIQGWFLINHLEVPDFETEDL